MTISAISLAQIRTGRVAPLGPARVPSGIAKAPRAGKLLIDVLGIEGDEQGDSRHHGGPEKAVHHYPSEHYSRWRLELPEAAKLFTVGGFGENLVASGWTEREVCVGDVVSLGSTILEVSQARQPCWKLNLRFRVPDMALRVQQSMRTGWYYRVLEPGTAMAGDQMKLIERRHPAWSLHRLLDVLYVDRLDIVSLQEMADLPSLAQSWRRIASARLERMTVENWNTRLYGQAII